MADIRVINLRDAPEHFDTIADRIWRAFWQPAPLDAVRTALADVVSRADYPFTLVALDGDRFPGTVTSIPDDMQERPDLSPWIAALWVELDQRGRGIARALIEQACAKLFALGHASVYLYCKPQMRDFYRQLGWLLHEDDVGESHYVIFVRHQAG